MSNIIKNVYLMVPVPSLSLLAPIPQVLHDVLLLHEQSGMMSHPETGLFKPFTSGYDWIISTASFTMQKAINRYKDHLSRDSLCGFNRKWLVYIQGKDQ